MALTLHQERKFATKLRIAEALERIATVLESYMAKIEEQEAHWKELSQRSHPAEQSERGRELSQLLSRKD